MVRNEQGFIILDDSKEIQNNLINKGRKAKIWLSFEGNSYLFKTDASNYEIWAELLAYELGKQCKLDMAEYDLGIYKGQYGVISKNFLNQDEFIMSGEVMLEFAQKIMYDNNKDKVTNSIEDIIGLLKKLSAILENKYSNDKIVEPLIKMWAFDGLIMESDRNPSNWSIIEKNNEFRLSPIYDCSTMARMNNNINDFILKLRNGYNIESLTNDIKYQLLYNKNDRSDKFLDGFASFCIENPKLSNEIINDFNNINVDLAIKQIELKINQNKPGEKVFVPWEVNFWLNKVIETRLKTMNKIYEEAKTNEKVLKLFP